MSSPLQIGINPAERVRNSRNGTGVVNDPHPIFDELRERGEVHVGSVGQLLGQDEIASENRYGVPVFSVVGYDVADQVFRRHEVWSSNLAYSQDLLGDSLLGMDEPEHRRYRTLVQPAFALRTMESWRDRWLSPVLDSLLDAIPESGADLYYDYCARFPAATIGRGFGARPVDIDDLHDIVLKAGGNAESPEEVAAATESLGAYLRELIELRRTSPSDDVISLLVQSEFVDSGGLVQTLTEYEVFGFANLLLTAGSGTTYRSMGVMLLALLERPELLEEVRRDRSIVPLVVEETLRWEPPVMYFPRMSRIDVELNGLHIPAGSRVEVVVTAANHDPRKFDRPHEFDPFRPGHPHLAFASGPHFCIGNQLARMEMGEALNRLLDRYSGIVLDPDVPRPYRTGLLFRMPTGLRVRLSGGSAHGN